MDAEAPSRRGQVIHTLVFDINIKIKWMNAPLKAGIFPCSRWIDLNE